MNFQDMKLYEKEFFSIGVDLDTGKYCLEIPVSTGIFDYSEYYALKDRAEMEHLINHYDELLELVKKCRARQNDENIMEEAWKVNRGC